MQSRPLRAWKLGLTTSHRSQVSCYLRSTRAISTIEGSRDLPLQNDPKSQVTSGQSVQSQPSRAWKLGLTTSHGSQVQVPSHFRSILAISTVESMEVGTYHFTKVPTVKSLEVNPCNPNCREHGSWDPSTSYRSQDPSLESLEVNMCNPNRREHESSDLPLHTSPKSQVPRLKFHLR